MWPLLYPPKGTWKFEKLNYRAVNFPQLLQELNSEGFNGYLEILALHEKGLLLFNEGEIVNCFYEGTEELNLTREEILQHFLETESQERDTIINVIEIQSQILNALGALESRRPLHRELETQFLDMSQFFTTLTRKRFTGVVRFYRIRNNTRLGNILLHLKKINTEQLKAAIRLQFSSNGALRLGDALVQMGAIVPADLEDALDRQTYTRKGSDIEIALALFYHGTFLGGYQEADGVLIQNFPMVLQWANMPETLMDLIEGILPPPINLLSLLPATAPTRFEGRNIESPSRVERRKISEETLSLKADDLILDIHGEEELPPVAGRPPLPKPSPTASVPGAKMNVAPIPPREVKPSSPEKSSPPPPPKPEREGIGPKKIDQAPKPSRLSKGPAGDLDTSLTFKNKFSTKNTSFPAPPAAEPASPPMDSGPISFSNQPASPMPEENPLLEKTGGANASADTLDTVVLTPGPGQEPKAKLTPSLFRVNFDSSRIPAEVQGLDFIRLVLEHTTGFLGLSLLERIRLKLEPSSRLLSEAQLRILVRDLVASLNLILGPSRARSLGAILNERISPGA